MARGVKRRKVNLTRDEFNHEAGFTTPNEFNRLFKRLHEMYGTESIKIGKKPYYPYRKEFSNPDSDLEFVFEWYPLLKALLTTLPNFPLYRSNANMEGVTVDQVTTYYDSLFEEIQALPPQLRFEVQSHTAYQKAVKERAILPGLARKIAETIEAIERITKQERPDIMAEMYRQLDNWAYNTFKNQYLIAQVATSNERHVDKMVESVAARSQDDGSVLEKLRDEKTKESGHASISELDLLLATMLKQRMSEITHHEEETLDADVQRYWQEAGVLGEGDSPTRDMYGMYYSAVGVPDSQDTQLEDTLGVLSRPKVFDNTQEMRAVRYLQEQAVLTEEQKKSQRLAAKENYIQRLKENIAALQDELERLNDDDDFLKEGTKLEDRMIQEYLEFCKDIHASTKKEYHSATDSFLGQLVARYFVRR